MNRSAIAALMATSALLLAACTGTGQQQGQSGNQEFVEDATFTMSLSGDPGALAPATAVQGTTNLLLSFAYDTLVYIGKNGRLVPGLAESWEVKPKSVEFTLNPDATCSDGSPVTPSVVADSINYTVDPKTGSPLLGVLIPADLSAEADDQAGTVTLQTKEPSQFLLHSTVAMFIMCGEGLEDPSVMDESTSGSGPYRLTEAVPNDHYTLKARPGYTWGPEGTATSDPGVPETVVLRVVTNESTAANLLLAGDLNAATFTGADRERVANAPDILTKLQPAGNGEFWYNQKPGLPGSDPAVREALTTALNLQEQANISTQGTGVKSTGMTTLSPRPCRVDSVSGHRPAHDPEAARAMLDQAGWTVGAGGVRTKNGQQLSMRILYNTDYGPGVKAEAEFMADAWEQIGVASQIKPTAGGAFSDALFSTGDWDVATVPVGVSLPSQLLGYVSGPPVPEGSNFAGIENAEYDRLAKRAATIPIDEGACEVWAQAESALFDDFDVVPVVEYTQMLASNGASVVIPGGLAQPTKFRMLRE